MAELKGALQTENELQGRVDSTAVLEGKMDVPAELKGKLETPRELKGNLEPKNEIHVHIDKSGPKGKDGVSPVVTVEDIENGHRITIIDTKGEQSFDVLNGSGVGGSGVDGKDGEDGATFVPIVSDIGVLSWTNNKGLENPEPVLIKGRDGVDGKDGYTPVKGVDYRDGVDGKDGYTPRKNIDYFDGRDGVDGKDGSNGSDGYTPVKGVDYWTDADKQEIKDMAVDTVEQQTPQILQKANTYTDTKIAEIPTPDVSGQINAHNTDTEAHNDLRLVIATLTQKVTDLLDSDDTTLDQMSEIVAYIKANRGLIESVTTAKVNVSDIIDNLTTNVVDKPLSAAQGVRLKALIDAISIPTKVSELENDKNYLTEHQSLAGYATEQWVEDKGFLMELPSHTHPQLNPAYTDRQKSSNIAIVGDNTLKKFVATSDMTTGKPSVGDGHILHFEWDNAGGYSSQIAVNNTTGQLEVRGMSGSKWNEWRRVLDSVNFIEFITPYLYYCAGDRIYIDYSTATYVTSGGTRIRWAIFLGREVKATSFNLSGSFTVRQNGNYLFGDGNENTSISALEMTNKKINGNVLSVDIVKNDGYTNAVNNSPVGVLFRGTITFT